MKLKFVLRVMLSLVLLTGTALSWADTLTASIDRDQMSLDETLSLHLLYQGRSGDEPDMSDLEANFEVLSRSHSSQYSIVNGRATSTVQWSFILSPRIAGRLLIPPFTIEGAQSKPLSVTVTESPDPGQAQAMGKDIYLETSVDKNSAYVQEQIKVSYRLFYAVPLSNLEPKLFQLNDVRTQELPRREYTQQVGHRNYNVIEFTVAVSTDKSGDIILPSLRWTAYADDPSSAALGFRSGRDSIHRLNTQELKLTIKPRPASFPADAPWLPAQNVQLSQTWSQPPDQFNVGEPITRTISLSAQGVSAEQLPTMVESSNSPDLKYYPDKPELDTQTSNTGLSATRTEAIAIVPNKAGVLTLPAVKISWWDVSTDELKITELPEQIIKVAEAGGTALPSTTPLPDIQDLAAPPPPVEVHTKSDPGFWPYLAGVLLLSNMCFIFLWLRNPPLERDDSHKIAPKIIAKSPADYFQQLLKACEQQEPKQARDSLLHWASAMSGKQFTRLTQVADWLNSPPLRESLDDLDRILFSSDHGQWQGEILAQRLKTWQNQYKSQAQQEDSELQSLY